MIIDQPVPECVGGPVAVAGGRALGEDGVVRLNVQLQVRQGVIVQIP